MGTVAVIGAGSFGTTVANVAAHNQPTRIWAHGPDLVPAIDDEHENPLFLAGFRLHRQLTSSNDLAEVLDGADLVIVGVPSPFYRAVLAGAPPIPADVPVLNLSKGIEPGTLRTMTQVLADVLPGHDRTAIGMLAGPNIAREIAAGEPTLAVVTFPDITVATGVLPMLRTDSFKVYSSDDVVSCEIAGTVKNVLAIGAGMADGLGFGANTKAALITRGLAEMTRLGLALGGRPTTFVRLAGNGDLIATCMSTSSRNHTVGSRLGMGFSLAEVLGDASMVSEGVKSCRALLDLAARHGVRMPICEQVGAVLHDGGSARDAMAELMAGPGGPEAQTRGLPGGA